MKTSTLAIAITSVLLSACGSSDSDNKPTKNKQSTPGFQAAQNGSLPAALDITMTCGTSQSHFGLGLFANGVVRVVSDDIVTDGSYSISENKLQLQLSSGINASSTSHLIFADILAGINLSDSLGRQYPCITRTHNKGQRFNQGEAFRCGRLNIGGEAADTFNLYADGSSDWANVYELPDGSDTTYRTRVGTYIFDSASGKLGLIYKGIDSDDVFTFEAQIAQGQVKMLAAPSSGDGSDAPAKACTVL